MLKVFLSVIQAHNFLLLILASVICILAMFTAFSFFQHAQRKPAQAGKMICIAAIASGLGIWASQFTFILAFNAPAPFTYDPTHILASMAVALVGSGLAWLLAVQTRPVRHFGGPMIGLAAAGSQYVSMSAVQTGFHITLDSGRAAASFVVCVAFATVAVCCDRRTKQDPAWLAAPLVTTGVCLLHLVAMTAANVQPIATHTIAAYGIDREAMATFVTGVSLLIMSIGAGNALVDRRASEAQLAAARGRALVAEEMLRGAAERERLANELRDQARISAAALDNMAQGLSMYDAQNCLVIHNRRYAELYCIPPELLKRGSSFHENHDALVEHGVLDATRDISKRAVTFDANLISDSEIRLRDGRIILFRRRPLPGGGWVATHDDVTDAREASDQIAYLAAHDALTGLPNRVTFAAHLEKATLRGEGFALLTIDLDRFKEVNDTLGHPVGDHILRESASRLRNVVGEGDMVTRLGGDEFAIFQRAVSSSAPSALAARVIERLAEPFEFDGHTVMVGASVGICLAPDHGEHADDLMRKSDLALYAAKEDARGTYQMFESGMDSRLLERRQLEADLRAAIQEGQFEVHYQPLLNVSSQRISGFEALVRWNHPIRGLVPPGDFIATAEDSGLIIPIGEWVLRQACRDAASWPADVKVAVNLSSAQFKRGDIVAMVMSALTAAGLDPKRLELEITETVLLHDEQWIRTMLEILTSVGIGIAMDDFGTGYSSLSYLRSFPFTKIKIDRSFVSDLTGTSDAFAIVQATIQLSQKLGMQIVAEGVETGEQMEMLAAEGCDQIQGYHVSRPVPHAQLGLLLSHYNFDADTSARATARK
ncbi:MAG: EAL domain-containing protein [Pseudomonas sp.]|uniref:bifunctional diguanylate cyclase/phosphodiesterase n=1 Tax=Pseudomonas sp. TaxID=306 RepID=UPI001221C917|nr:EAL domain-containing protein [Pseudomonas sp.]RZI70576.1 MAG: EAL domain-containing protein [Pseudomonas sp.]